MPPEPERSSDASLRPSEIMRNIDRLTGEISKTEGRLIALRGELAWWQAGRELLGGADDER
jgi:hypothetical protein